jgi:hypothetical protein
MLLVMIYVEYQVGWMGYMVEIGYGFCWLVLGSGFFLYLGLFRFYLRKYGARTRNKFE